MSKILHFQTDVFKQLLRLKFTNVYSVIKDKFINLSIWAGCCMIVSGYLMQPFGLSKDFGPFQFAAILASVGLFEMYGNAIALTSDIEGNRAISYYLTLPTTAATVLFSYVCYYAIVTTFMSITLLPLAKIILWNQLSLTTIAWPKFLFFLMLINSVCATSTLLFSALVPSMDKFDMIFTRFIFPLWFLGGFQFSWASVHSTTPWLSYLMLLNPVTYTTEGMRAALIGQDKFLPFWICCVVLIAIWVGIGTWALKALKKRLDFVG